MLSDGLFVMTPPNSQIASQERDPSLRANFTKFLRDLRRRKTAAIERLVDRYESLAMNTVRRHLGTRLRERVDSHDLRQDFWVSVIRRIDRLPSIADSQAFRGYLRRVAFRQVTKQQRRHLVAASRRLTREVPLSAFGDGRGGILARSTCKLDAAHTGEDVMSRVQSELSERESGILKMKLDGLSNREIGRRLGVNEGSVRRALRKIARAFVDGAPTES